MWERALKASELLLKLALEKLSVATSLKLKKSAPPPRSMLQWIQSGSRSLSAPHVSSEQPVKRAKTKPKEREMQICISPLSPDPHSGVDSSSTGEALVQGLFQNRSRMGRQKLVYQWVKCHVTLRSGTDYYSSKASVSHAVAISLIYMMPPR